MEYGYGMQLGNTVWNVAWKVKFNLQFRAEITLIRSFLRDYHNGRALARDPNVTHI